MVGKHKYLSHKEILYPKISVIEIMLSIYNSMSMTSKQIMII